MNPEYAKYLMSSKWKRKRYRAMKLAGWWCQVCNNAKAVDVHHLTYERIFNELASDLRAVCRDCHGKLHSLPLEESTEAFEKMEQHRRWNRLL